MAMFHKVFWGILVIVLCMDFDQILSLVTYRTIVCDNVKVVILCPNKGDIIKLLYADYGRWNRTKCIKEANSAADQDINCRTGSVANKSVSAACDGKKSCTVQSTIDFLDEGQDPCWGTHKYLNMTYHCLTPKKKAILNKKFGGNSVRSF